MPSFGRPLVIQNWIGGIETPAVSGATFAKPNPVAGHAHSSVARSRAPDIGAAECAAQAAQPAWAEISPVKRGFVLHKVAQDPRDLSLFQIGWRLIERHWINDHPLPSALKPIAMLKLAGG